MAEYQTAGIPSHRVQGSRNWAMDHWKYRGEWIFADRKRDEEESSGKQDIGWEGWESKFYKSRVRGSWRAQWGRAWQSVAHRIIYIGVMSICFCARERIGFRASLVVQCIIHVIPFMARRGHQNYQTLIRFLFSDISDIRLMSEISGKVRKLFSDFVWFWPKSYLLWRSEFDQNIRKDQNKLNPQPCISNPSNLWFTNRKVAW